MSAASSPASADSTSQSEETPCGCARPTRTAAVSSSSGSPASPASPTSASSTTPPHGSTSLSAATPASRSASQGSAEATATRGISGRSSPDSFAYYSPESRSLRTSQGTLLSDSTPCSVILPAWGWMRAGELYERPMLAPLTAAHGCSSLLPTPAAQEPGFKNLTPLTKDGETPTHGAQRWYDEATGRLLQKGLAQVAALLPTPAAVDGSGGKIGTRERVLSGRNGTGTKKQISMQEAVTYLLPTPTTQDGANTSGPSQLRRNSIPLNGAFTPTPSSGGNEPLDGRLPGQLTIGDA